jgi:arsenate reductase (thioredoxin)
MRKVLFVCVHNSGRSQMAQGFLNHLCGDRFLAESAGITPAKAVTPHVVRVMQEAGIDISGNKPKSVFDIYKTGEVFSYIITVCDQATAEQCPVFLGLIKQIHWSFPDPSKLTGTEDEKFEQLRQIRNAIRDKILSWCVEVAESEETL